MSHLILSLKTLSRSTAFSCLLHVAAIVTIACVPRSLLERFTTSGQRQVIAVEMTLAPPSPSAVSMSMEAVQPPVEIEAPILIEPTQRTEPPAQRQQDHEASAGAQVHDPSIPHAFSLRMSKRQELPAESPKITQRKVPRPRRPHSVSTSPLASLPALETLAGLSEARVEFLSNPAPKYPAEAVAAGIEGTVRLRLLIDRRGQVTRADVVQSSGSVLLDEAARTAVLSWSGKPARRAGHAVPSEEVLPIRFRL